MQSILKDDLTDDRTGSPLTGRLTPGGSEK